MIRVLWCEFVAMSAMGFASVDADEALTTRQVLLGGDGFEMCRLDAAAIAAQVVEREPIRDRPHKHLIRNAVRLSTVVFGNVELPIPVCKNGADPVPTVVTDEDLAKETPQRLRRQLLLRAMRDRHNPHPTA